MLGKPFKERTLTGDGRLLMWCLGVFLTKPCRSLMVLFGPPLAFLDYIKKKVLSQKSRKNGAQYATKSKTYKVHAHHYIV